MLATISTERKQLLSKESATKDRYQDRQEWEESTIQGEDVAEETNTMSWTHRLFLGPITLFLTGMILWLAFTGFVVVSPGELAVVVTLGHVAVYMPGPHFRTPFVSTVHTMSTKTQLISEKNNIPTKEGLSVSLDVALLYRIDPNMAGQLYQNIGIDYAQILIEPEAASVIRGLTSESDAKALYSSGRHEIQDAVKAELDKTLGKQGIIIESVMLKDLELPPSLSQAIEQKAQAEQESARMEFILTKEKQEAERKAIEARGIADYQKIVSEGITELTLKWKGIEVTEKLAASPNTKIVIMGNSEGDLPVILSGN